MEVPGQNCKSDLAKFVQVDIKVIQKLYMLEFLEFPFFFQFYSRQKFQILSKIASIK